MLLMVDRSDFGALAVRTGRVFVRGAQRQRQGVHAPLLGGSEFRFKGRVDGARPGNPADALERGTDHQHVEVRLAAGLGAGVAGMAGTVVLHGQQRRGKRRSEDGVQAIGSGRLVCHDGVIGLLPRRAKCGRPAAICLRPRCHPV